MGVPGSVALGSKVPSPSASTSTVCCSYTNETEPLTKPKMLTLAVPLARTKAPL